MASNQLSCQFSDLETDFYPPRCKDCQGDLVAIEECQESDDNGYSESSLILLRSGLLKDYDQNNHWYVCEKHRKVFGFGFPRELKQKKCLYSGHSGSEKTVMNVSWDRKISLLNN